MSINIKKIPDADGATLTVKEVDGRLYPDFDDRAIQGVATLEARADDVAICAYPKSGTHWVWEIIRQLLANTTELPLVEKDDYMIEDRLPEVLMTLPSPRVLNTHVHFEVLPPDFYKKKVKVLYITRDPRDVAVSYYNHHKKLVQYYQYTGQWDAYFSLFLEGNVDYESWFTYTKGWEKGMLQHPDLDCHVTSYEALHADLFNELRKLCNFLGIERDDEFIRKVIDKTSFNNMRVCKGEKEIFQKSGSPIMYRKGKVGDWKNWFKVTQSEIFNKRFEQEMAGTKAYDLYSHTLWRDPNMNQK